MTRVHRQAGVVVDVVEVLAVAGALVLVVELLGDLLDQRMVLAARDVGAALQALGFVGADVVDVDFVEPVDR